MLYFCLNLLWNSGIFNKWLLLLKNCSELCKFTRIVQILLDFSVSVFVQHVRFISNFPGVWASYLRQWAATSEAWQSGGRLPNTEWGSDARTRTGEGIQSNNLIHNLLQFCIFLNVWINKCIYMQIISDMYIWDKNTKLISGRYYCNMNMYMS